MINMNLLAVVTPTSIYHVCSTRKTFWEENFKGEENFTLGDFTAVNMKIVVVKILVNTEISRIVIITSPWTSR